MAAVAEPGELVALLYRADWTTLSLSATVRHRTDWELRWRLARERNPAPPGRARACPAPPGPRR